MARSQRHMLWEQGATAAGEIHAQGVVAPGIAQQVDPEALNVLKAGPPLFNDGLEPKTPRGEGSVEVPIGAPGGPLSGSSLTGAIPEGLAPPDGGGGEPEPGAPTISGITPPSGVVGEAMQITLTGTGYTADSIVKVDGNAVVSAYVSETEMTADLPSVAAAGTVTVTVVTDGVSSPGALFSFSDAQQSTRSFPIGPINLAKVEDHADGIQLTLSETTDIRVGDTVTIAATGNTSVNGSYTVLSIDPIVVDNPIELPSPIDGLGRVTVTGGAG